MMIRWHLGALASMISFASCQASFPATVRNTDDSARTTEYNSQMRGLFDDQIGGISLESYATPVAPESNTLLSRRILEADSIVLCQIRTITEGSGGGETTSKLEFRGAGQSLANLGQEECPVISVSRQSYSYLLIHHSSDSLIGRTIVLFLRKFDEMGQVTFHWHVEPDGARIRDEVKRIGSPIH